MRGAALLPRGLRKVTLRAGLKELHAAFGGRIRYLVTVMAPIRMSTLRLFNGAGLPLYQGYGLTEVGMLTANREHKNRLGTVGQCLPGKTITLSPEGEVVVETPTPLSRGYLFLSDEEARKTFLPDGRVATGDLGEYDADGYLVLRGRKKEILVTAGGVKVNPAAIESRVLELPEISNVAVYGNGLPHLCIVASANDGAGDLEQRIRTSARAATAAPVGKIFVTTSKFTRENGLLTRNFKVHRERVWAEFKSNLRHDA
jgi:long-subunit acyl-CoA synthetase (AMP-forming)